MVLLTPYSSAYAPPPLLAYIMLVFAFGCTLHKPQYVFVFALGAGILPGLVVPTFASLLNIPFRLYLGYSYTENV